MNKLSLGLALVAVVIAIIALVVANSIGFGGGTRMPNGISADSTAPNAGQVRGTTLTVTGASSLSGSITGATSNTATTSLVSFGCIQTVATSTATPIRLEFGATSAATTTFGAAGIGSVAWRYGTCP